MMLTVIFLLPNLVLVWFCFVPITCRRDYLYLREREITAVSSVFSSVMLTNQNTELLVCISVYFDSIKFEDRTR